MDPKDGNKAPFDDDLPDDVKDAFGGYIQGYHALMKRKINISLREPESLSSDTIRTTEPRKDMPPSDCPK